MNLLCSTCQYTCISIIKWCLYHLPSHGKSQGNNHSYVDCLGSFLSKSIALCERSFSRHNGLNVRRQLRMVVESSACRGIPKCDVPGDESPAQVWYANRLLTSWRAFGEQVFFTQVSQKNETIEATIRFALTLFSTIPGSLFCPDIGSKKWPQIGKPCRVYYRTHTLGGHFSRPKSMSFYDPQMCGFLQQNQEK